MDPATAALGIAAGVASIITVIGRSVNFLQTLRTQYCEAELNITLLIGQLQIVQAALHQVEAWMKESLSFNAQHRQLLFDLNGALGHCRLLVEYINSQLARLDWNGCGGLKCDSKLLVIFEDAATKDCLTKLDHQISALNLCLTAFRCRSPQDQKLLLESVESRSIFAQARDDTTSLKVIADATSPSVSSTRESVASVRTQFSKSFDFDDILLSHKVYQDTFRSMLRRTTSPAERQKKKPRSLSDNTVLRLKSSAASSAQIDSLIKKDARERSRIVKILVLGTQHAAIVKQLRSKCGLPYTENESETYRRSITALVVNALVAIVNYVELNGAGFVSQQSEDHANVVRHLANHGSPDWEITPEILRSVNATWENWSVQQSFQTMNQDCITAYYLKSTERIIRPGYRPSLLDMIKAPETLDYVRETKLTMKNMTAEMVEVPNGSAKIFHHFDGINACLFTIDLASYDQYLDGEGSCNSLKSSMAYLNAVCTSQWFSSSCVLLCFINTGVFARKLTKSPLQAHFETYRGGSDLTAATQHMLKRCQLANRLDLPLFWHFAEDDAQDPSTIRFVRESLTTLPTAWYLREMGIHTKAGTIPQGDNRRGRMSPTYTI